jgi:hypothetical protein
MELQQVGGLDFLNAVVIFSHKFFVSQVMQNVLFTPEYAVLLSNHRAAFDFVHHKNQNVCKLVSPAQFCGKSS